MKNAILARTPLLCDVSYVLKFDSFVGFVFHWTVYLFSDIW